MTKEVLRQATWEILKRLVKEQQYKPVLMYSFTNI